MSHMSDSDKDLSPKEQARLDRMRNRRGRRAPAIMPAKLARTSAFVPRTRQLNTDSNFRRVYVVPGHSITEVAGRELGTQHRDALYAIFRFRGNRIEIPNPAFNPALQIGGIAPPRTLALMQVVVTWREVLRTMGLTEHVNNLVTVLDAIKELKQVVITVFRGDYRQYLARSQRGQLAGPGWSDNLIGHLDWEGVNLDSRMTIQYGDWVREMFELSKLVSVNADVYFRLKSEYAKAFWPFLDSQPAYHYVDEPFLAQLAGRDLAQETTKQRMKFREEVRQAMTDMQSAGGLADWSEEVVGRGRGKLYRWHYRHALPRQCELDLAAPAAPVAEAPSGAAAPKTLPASRARRRRASDQGVPELPNLSSARQSAA